MRIRSRSRVDSTISTAVPSVFGVNDVEIPTLQHARQGEEVAHVVVNDEHLAVRRNRRPMHPGVSLRGARAAFDAPAGTERPPRAAGPANRRSFERSPSVRSSSRRFFLGRQILAGVDDDRQRRQLEFAANLLHEVEPRHVREPQVEDHAAVAARFAAIRAPPRRSPPPSTSAPRARSDRTRLSRSTSTSSTTSTRLPAGTPLRCRRTRRRGPAC